MKQWLVVAACCLSTWSGAQAQSDVVRSGIELFDAGEWSKALEVLNDAAQARRGLTRDDLLSLFKYRAMICFAEGLESQASEDMASLVTLQPGASLPSEAPPQMRESLRQLSIEHPEPIAVMSSPTRDGRAATIEVKVVNDLARMSREVRLYYRTKKRGPWAVNTNRRLSLVEPSAIEYYVEVASVGGAVVATSGDADSPLIVPAAQAIAPPDGGSEGDDSTVWWLVGGGAVVVAAGVIAAILIGSASATEATVTAPDFEPIMR